MGIHIMPPLFKIVIEGPKYGPEQTSTFRPDAHPETSSVDGYTQCAPVSPYTWALCRDGPGTLAISSGAPLSHEVRSDYLSPRWADINRSHMLFDTSAIAVGSKINSAYLQIYVYSKSDTAGWKPRSLLTPTNPASNTDLVKADHNTVTDTILSNEINYDDIVIGWNTFTLTEAGLLKITPGGVSKFCGRTHYDVYNTAPTWVASKNAGLTYHSAETNINYRPLLSVTFQPPL